MTNSADWLAHAKHVIATGASTLSKRSRAFVEGSSPVAFTKAKGAYFWDIEGRKFLDWSQALGPNILGAAHPYVTQAVCRALRNGNLATVPSALEPIAAERLIALSPYANLRMGAGVRFVNSGTEACAAAVRIARRYTGNDAVLSSGYHGWLEPFMCLQPFTHGIPAQYREMIEPFEWGKIATLEAAIAKASGRIAAVILEPAVYEAPPENYWARVRQLTHAAGALLISDDTVTGFRYQGDTLGRGLPDLAIYGKAIGAGAQPVACVIGRADVMQFSDAISGTYCGSAAAMAAVIATCDVYADKGLGVYQHIWEIGERLRDGINEAATAHNLPLRCEGMPPRMHLTWPEDTDNVNVSKVVEQLALRGIHMNPGGILPSYAHTKAHVRQTVAACQSACKAIADGVPLNGLPFQPAFRREPTA